VPYTQHDTITDVFGVPCDLSTETGTIVSVNIFKPEQGAPVFRNAGRFVTALDGTSELQARQKNSVLWPLGPEPNYLKEVVREKILDITFLVMLDLEHD
jgi:hypothetical protein